MRRANTFSSFFKHFLGPKSVRLWFAVSSMISRTDQLNEAFLTELKAALAALLTLKTLTVHIRATRLGIWHPPVPDGLFSHKYYRHVITAIISYMSLTLHHSHSCSAYILTCSQHTSAFPVLSRESETEDVFVPRRDEQKVFVCWASTVKNMWIAYLRRIWGIINYRMWLLRFVQWFSIGNGKATDCDDNNRLVHPGTLSRCQLLTLKRKEWFLYVSSGANIYTWLKRRKDLRIATVTFLITLLRS